ncbi:hypothetical protein FQR65_LT00673 [Abscondita terminalis]|nr:hypothetical protein FQR65_LT00673 [Abscondita terminalis]
MISSIFLKVLLSTIVHKYLQNSTCLIIISQNSDNYVLSSTIPIVNVQVTDNTIQNKLLFRNYGCQAILIVHQNSSLILQQLEYQMKMHNDRFNSRKYLIVADDTDIFLLSELEYIVDFLLIVPANSSEEECILLNDLCWVHGIFELVTHKYVGAVNNSFLVTLDFWSTRNNSFAYGNNLYPDKLSNQRGRELRCATFTYKPYSIVGKTQEESPPYTIGSENAIAHEFAKKLNMSIQYVVDDKEWGIIYDNWTGDGVLGHIATDKADIGYAALYTWAHEYQFLDLSKPVVRTGITCLVPAPKYRLRILYCFKLKRDFRLAAGWITPLMPFSKKMWLYFCLSFVLISTATITITAVITKQKLETKNHRSKKEQPIIINYRVIFNQCLMRITKIFLMQSISPTKKYVDVAFKYMFSIFLYSLVISACYSSGLSTVMTIPRYSGAINDVTDLANSDLNWGATQDAWIYSILEEERKPYIILLHKFIAASEENLREFAKTNKFAFSIERLPSGQFAIGSYITEDIVIHLRLMKEDLYWEYCVLMTRKNSPLLIPLDSLILILNEAGLIKFWEEKATQYHMNLRVQNIVAYYRASQTKEPHPVVMKLRWLHVEGAFGILIGGYVFSILYFLIEVFYSKKLFAKKQFLM